MDQSKKVIFLDVDGTLVDYDGSIPESAKKAVRKAVENGHRVYFCTGRSRTEVYDELWNLGVNGMIGGNGNYIEDEGVPVFEQTLTGQECQKIVDWLKDRGLEFYLESNSGLYASENFERKGERAVQEYAKSKDAPNPTLITVRDAFPEMIFGESPYRSDVNKISFVLSDYSDYLEACRMFEDLTVGTWGGREEKAIFGDIGVKQVSKGKAISTLLDYLGKSSKDAIAFGDAKVDIPLFAACAVGVAMGNSEEELKEIADLVTDDVSEDGLYNAFEKLGLL